MGNDVSKEINDIVDVLEVKDTLCMSPSNGTLSAQIDPGSPSERIMRTPIEVRKNLELSEESCLLRRRWKSEPELTPVKMDHADNIVLCDPRSPTIGIARTPILVPCGEKVHYAETMQGEVPQNVKAFVDVPDCRSPSLGICRTPIQIAAPDENESIQNSPIVQPIVDLKLDSKLHTNLSEPWLTPISKKIASPSFVYTDDVDIKRKSDMKQYDQTSVHEKENDTTLKRKLKFTPELIKSGIKVRTPLGSRCNFQDSPSQFLKKIQTQKVDEELGYVSENASSSSNCVISKPIKKSQPVVEWDNKDSTLIM